jgi:two-component system OmpR family response regulator
MTVTLFADQADKARPTYHSPMGAAAPATKTVLVVDDDPAMRGMITDYLLDRGFLVNAATGSQDMERILASGSVDLIVLDLKLADGNGLELIPKLRCESSVPIIIITGYGRDEVDRVVGLEMGADDYITKPFGLRELQARIGAVLRRAEATAARRVEAGTAQKRSEPARYRFGGWELDLHTRRLRSPGGSLVSLSKGEFDLLAAFVRAPQRVLSREQLLTATRLHGDEVYDRSIDVQILRLRRKLETDPSQPALIRTERGAGYILAAPVETVSGATPIPMQ